MSNSSPSGPMTGGCLCGAVRFSIEGPLRDVTICHCGMCRRSTTCVGAYTACAPDAISVTGPKLRSYRSSPVARRGYCSRCRSALFWEPSDGHHLSVALGSLDDGSGLKLGRHIYVDHDPTLTRAMAQGVE